jgi:hemerythrin-like domain-containing protein
MCDYCDCRSHPEIAGLAAEHEHLEALLRELAGRAGAGDEAGARAVLAQLRADLEHHAGREEAGIFAALRAAGVDRAYVGRFLDDHDELHALVTGSGDWREQAGEVTRLLHAHIHREESDLFPAAHQLLTPAQWDGVAAAADRPRPARR